MHDYDEGVADDARDRRDIADEIEVELLIKRRIDGVVRCGKEEGIAIWGSADDRLGAEIGASAGPVFDDERLAEPLRQPLADHARNNVSRAARGKWHDQTHRPRRIGLRLRDARDGRQRGSAGGQMQNLSTVGKFHDALLWSRPCDLAKRHLIASAPACAILESSFASTPDTPMPPTILPSTTIGMPPSISITPRTVKYRNPAPSPAITSSSAFVGRRNSIAVRALPSAIPIEASCVPSRRCSITA